MFICQFSNNNNNNNNNNTNVNNNNDKSNLKLGNKLLLLALELVKLSACLRRLSSLKKLRLLQDVQLQLLVNGKDQAPGDESQTMNGKDQILHQTSLFS